ncbi:hypothetical protein ACJX0J_025303 [Zea mays]
MLCNLQKELRNIQLVVAETQQKLMHIAHFKKSKKIIASNDNNFHNNFLAARTLLEGCQTLAVGTKAIINLGLEKVPSQEEAGIHFRLQLLVFSILQNECTHGFQIVEELFEADKGGNKANGFPNNNYHVVLPFFKCSYYCIDNGIIKFFMQLSCTSLFMVYDQIHYFGFSRVDKNYATD